METLFDRQRQYYAEDAKAMIRALISLIFFFLSLPTFAAIPAWEIAPNDSTIHFTAKQNGSTIKGQFTSFNGEMRFDPEQLASSNMRINVDTNSTTTAYDEMANPSKTTNRFNINTPPQAVFKASAFKKIDHNTYQANGTLTIRDKTLPATLKFILDKQTSKETLAKGFITLEQTAFDMEKNEWANTKDIKDNVMMNFIVVAKK